MEIHRIVPNEYQGELATGKRFRLHRAGRRWQLTTWNPGMPPGPDDVTDDWPSLQSALDELQQNEGNASFDGDDWLPILAGTDGSDCGACAFQPVTGILSHDLKGRLQEPKACRCERYSPAEAPRVYDAWDQAQEA